MVSWLKRIDIRRKGSGVLRGSDLDAEALRPNEEGLQPVAWKTRSLIHESEEATMRNIKIKISIGMSETEEAVTGGDGLERLDDGSFSVILDHKAEFDIDRLENTLLQTSYPALRTALSEHLEQASKKSVRNF